MLTNKEIIINVEKHMQLIILMKKKKNNLNVEEKREDNHIFLNKQMLMIIQLITLMSLINLILNKKENTITTNLIKIKILIKVMTKENILLII